MADLSGPDSPYLKLPPRRIGQGKGFDRHAGAIYHSDDVRADMDKIRAFFADAVARHPDQVGEIRLREEDERSQEAAEADQT